MCTNSIPSALRLIGTTEAWDCSNLLPVAIISCISCPNSFTLHLRQFYSIGTKTDCHYGGLRLLEFTTSCCNQLNFHLSAICTNSIPSALRMIGTTEACLMLYSAAFPAKAYFNAICTNSIPSAPSPFDTTEAWGCSFFHPDAVMRWISCVMQHLR